ncbi:hypothetical protein WP8W19C03_27390 [Aeromonas veronii]|uniref:hypothetical protein n=1 Tax=Aeromonas veronii TaxID=654 RepID=UPI0015DC3975|nr:hypothetical protein [Aeromonas veronii]BBT96045.1 hypothetical protein WP8W19C03_27390 [Aeromonas veronii]
MVLNLKAANIISSLLAVIGFASFYPIAFPGAITAVKIIQLILPIVLISLSLKANLKLNGYSSAWFFVFLSLIFSFFYTTVASWITLGSLAFFIALLMPRAILSDAGLKFEKIFFWIITLGLVIHFLLIIGVNMPYFIVNIPHKEVLGFYYKAYFLNVELLHISDSANFGRFSSVFDEPGVVGTLCGLILVYRGLRFDNKANWVYLMAGIASLSAAFFIILLIGYLVRFKDYKKSLLVISVLVISFFGTAGAMLASNQFSTDSLVYRYLISRFINYENLNNRESVCFKNKMAEFMDSDNMMFGEGVGSVSTTGCDVSSTSVLVYEYGVVGGVLLIVVNFLFFVFLNKKITGLYISRQFLFVFAIPFLASFYQRPYIFHLGMFFLFFIYANHPKKMDPEYQKI